MQEISPFITSPLHSIPIMHAQKFEPSIQSTPFGRMPDGSPVQLFTMTAREGLRVAVTNYGGALQSLWTPDRSGEAADIVLGYDTLPEYLAGRSFLGAMAGRYANRIGNASFALDGVEYRLPNNEGPNHLHGGDSGFNRKLWSAEIEDTEGAPALILSRVSPDGEEGYPGNLQVRVTYALVDALTLRIAYRAETDRATPINLTNHSYFNLTGDPRSDILSHVIQIFSDGFTHVDTTQIPSGGVRPVDGTPFDFRRARRIGERICAPDEQLRIAGGYDQNFVILGPLTAGLRQAAAVYEPYSGRILDVFTSEPAVQFYSGNFLDGTQIGKGGVSYRRRSGFCLETQHYPDSPNKPLFPNTILRPGEIYSSSTIYRFGVRQDRGNANDFPRFD